MFKNYLLLTSLLSLIIGSSNAQGFQAFLSGNHQPTPVMSAAYGMMTASLVGDSLKLGGDFMDMVTGVDTSIAGGAHIHQGIAGTNGGVSFVLKPTLSEGLNGGMFEVASNTFILDDDAKEALESRRLYINIHSNRHGSGEIRGQIIPAADEVYTANLFGSNQSTSIMSSAQGSVIAEVHGDTVIVTGSFRDLSAPLAEDILGGIHIHQGVAGSDGGVLRPLVANVSGDGRSAELEAVNNAFVFSEEELSSLRDEGWYINVHSENWREGELRGQLTPVAAAKFRSNLSSTNEAPSITSFASGKLALSFRDGNLTLSGSFEGLESDFNTAIAGGAHIHMGMPGQNGGAVFSLNASLNDDNRSGIFHPADNTFPISEEDLVTLMDRGTYVNIHSMAHPGGELRGQILPEAHYFLHATLTGSQQTTPVLTNATGAVIVEVLGGGITVSGSFNELSSALATDIANGAHIHLGPVGSDGPVAFALAPTPGNDEMSGTWRAVDNQFGASPGRQDSLRARLGYINVHSADWQGGEIRGQLMHEARAYFFAPLSGAEATPSVITDAAGAAMMEYNGTQARVVGSFSGLSSPLNTDILGGAHLHGALAGSNGGVLTPLQVAQLEDGTSGTFDIMDNVYEVTSGWMDTVRQRGVYFNIHSENVASGELRGQLRPLANNYYLANLRGKNASIPIPSTGRGAIILEQTGTAITASGSLNNLMSDFAVDISGGAHLHLGMPGMDGGILVFLNATLGSEANSATFPADSNMVDIADSVRLMLEAGNTYVNIHSVETPGGEIRGQMLHEINFAPLASALTSPSSGDTISTGGDPSASFGASWDPSTDPNGHKVVYVWQLSTTRDFSVPALSVNTGESTEFMTTLGHVDTLLSSLGVDSGSMVVLYHRVTASDGSLCASSTVDSVLLVKGTLTNVRENPYLDHDILLYPSPALDRITIQVDMKIGAKGALQILDLKGKVVNQQRLSLFAGQNLLQHNVAALPSGSYLARLILNQEIALAKKFVKY